MSRVCGVLIPSLCTNGHGLSISSRPFVHFLNDTQTSMLTYWWHILTLAGWHPGLPIMDTWVDMCTPIFPLCQTLFCHSWLKMIRVGEKLEALWFQLQRIPENLRRKTCKPSNTQVVVPYLHEGKWNDITTNGMITDKLLIWHNISNVGVPG